jgi:hypothetical protein
LDFFRSAVIEALGRHRATYAVDAIAGVAGLDGPLRDDAILALGRIGGAAAMKVLGELKDPSPAETLRIRGAQCLAEQGCAEHVKALAAAAVATGVRADVPAAAVSALAAIAEAGNAGATAALIDVAGGGGALRELAALAFAGVAVRRPDHVIAWMDAAPEGQRSMAIDLLKDGFDRLEEDFAEEQFYAAARATYWKATEGSPTRSLAALLIQKLEF